MGAFFNLDFEKFIFSGKKKYIPHKNINLAYEYLMLYLENDVCLQGEYESSFINHVSNLSQHEFTFSKNITTYWINDFLDIENKKRLNSKIELYQFYKLHNIYSDFEIFKYKNEKLLKGKVVKYDGGFSGNKVFFEKAPFSPPFIVEGIKKRTLDFSLLFSEGDSYGYVNVISDKLNYKETQYRGLDAFEFIESLDIDSKKKNKFLFDVELIRKKFIKNDLRGIWSLDSFLYLEDGDIQIHPGSEINFRKTMGYLSINIAKKLGGNKFKFSLTNSESIQLAPPDSRYQSSISLL